MGTITLKNFRTTSDVKINTALKDGGIYVDWSEMSDIKAWLWSDAQKALAGRCDVRVDAGDGTNLICEYASTKAQYPGVNRLIVQATYMGATKTYDKPVFNFVRWTADQAGEQITIDDPEVDVTIEATDVSSSILQEAIAAALAAAEHAEHAASLVPLQVLQDCEAATAVALTAASKAPVIGENGNWWVWNSEQETYVDTGNVARGPRGNGITSWSVVESQEDDGENVITVTFTDGEEETFTVKNGKTGNGIASIVQTVESPDDAGTNVITVTMTNGTVVTFNVKNGSKGQPGAAQAAYKSVETLPAASAETMDKIYLTPSETTGVFNMSYTDFDGTDYSWVDLGTTAIQLSDYATKAEVTQLQGKVDELDGESAKLLLTNGNILVGETPESGKFINPNDGSVQNLAGFFSFFEIPIPEGVTKLWPYSSYPTSTYCFRSIVYLDENKDFISGLGGTLTIQTVGAEVPGNTKYISVCYSFNNGSPGDYPDYYLSTEQGNPTHKYLAEDTKVKYSQLEDTPSIPSKTSELVNDSDFATLYQVADADTIPTDIIDQAKRQDGVFINPNTGEETANNGFFSFIGLSIPVGVQRLWPFNSSAPTLGNCFRSIIFRDAFGGYISGTGGSAYITANGVEIPEGAVSVSVSFNWQLQTEPDNYYLSTEQGNPTRKVLDEKIIVPYNNIQGVPSTLPRIKLYPKTKLPCLSIHFDDCNWEGDKSVVDFLDSVGCVCDFAFIANPAYFNGELDKQYLLLNKRGYGIQNHSVDGRAYNTTNFTYETALQTILLARKRLESAGFVVNGFVAPSSAMEESFKPILAINGAYAFTTSTNDTTINGRLANRCDLHRYPMHTFTLNDIKTFIDGCITNDQIITLYGHTADFGNTYGGEEWNLDKVKNIVQYVIQKRDAGLLYFGNSDNCVKYYFDL